MKLKKRHIIWIVIILVILILLGRFLIFSFSLNSLKPAIESELAEITGMKTTIRGNVHARLLPSLSIVVKDISLSNGEKLQIRIEKLELEFPLSSFYSSSFKVKALLIRHPQVSMLVKSIDTSVEIADASLREEQQTVADSLDWEIDLANINIYKGSFTYYNENNRDTLLFKGISLNSDVLQASGNADTLMLEDFMASGLLRVEDARINTLRLENIKLDVSLDKGVLTVSHQSDGYHGERNSGHLAIDFSGDEPSYSLRQDIQKFRMERLLAHFDKTPLMKGEMDFSLSLDFYGKKVSNRWLTSNGKILLKGKTLTLYGINIDMLAKKYARSQKFSLVDIGAFFLAGPLGIAITKGGEYAILLTSNKGDSTEINEFVSVWKVKAGELYAEDVAFSTARNRIALRGSLNIWQEIFNGLDIALINDHGCAVFHQQLSGSFYDPEVSDVKVVKTLLGPVKNIFTGKKCKHVFYEGSVLPPEQKE
ncbi:MAG: AsmA family protein [Bacteroidetes bacterium]|nr:AsmA family protein [Bacteroidota bacterium]